MLMIILLICSERFVVSAEDEMAILVRWSTENKLVINLLKTKVMVFHRPSSHHVIPPPPVDIKGVYIYKLLSVTLCSDLLFGEQISKVLASYTQHLYLICQFKTQGIPVSDMENF
jgi:hypothetical protein